MYFSSEDVFRAEHEAITKVIDLAEEHWPEDYLLERVQGIQLMAKALLDKKEGDS